MTARNPVTLVCWNIEHKRASWRMLREMEADVALLQEARPPPADVDISLHDINDPGEWPEGRAGRVAIVRLCDRFTVEFIEKSFTKNPNLLAAERQEHRRRQGRIGVGASAPLGAACTRVPSTSCRKGALSQTASA